MCGNYARRVGSAAYCRASSLRWGRVVRVCIVSYKECWQDATGRWLSHGGFPSQMAAIASLFQETTLVIVRGAARPGGIPLSTDIRIVPLSGPVGTDARRKLSVLASLPYYLSAMTPRIRAADAVHVPLPGDLSLLALLVACALRKPLIARYGGSWISNTQTTLMDRVTRQCMRVFAGGRNIMLATGDDHTPPAPRMHWIFSTALTEAELIAIRPRLDRRLADPPRVVYVGRLSPEKGVDQLVRAIAHLRQEGVARAALSRRLLDADIAVQPSLSEGMCKAWLDAFAHGVPVVASAVGAAAAVIGRAGERGWLVPPGDVRALAVALQRALNAPIDWSALRARCRAYVDGRTLEGWAQAIRARCEHAWGVTLRNGPVAP